MAADTRTRLETHDPKRFRCRSIDHVPNVDAHSIAEQRHLVDKRDVDGPERVFEYLRHLGDTRARNTQYFRNRLFVEGRRHVETLGGNGAHDLIRIVRVEAFVTRIDSLGGESQEEIFAADQLATLQNRKHDFFRRPRIGRALENDELTRSKLRRDVVHYVRDIRDIRFFVRRQRCRNADDDDVAASEPRHIRRRGELSGCYDAREILVADVANVVETLIRLRNPNRAAIECEDLKVRLRLLDGKR